MSRYQKVTVLFLAGILVLLALEVVTHISFVWYGAWCLWYFTACTVGAFVLSAKFFVPVKYKGTASKKAISITFDDGPVYRKTEQILAVLEQHKVPAAFFCIGSRIAEHPDLLKQIDQAGHMVGNHSYYHGTTFDLLSSAQVVKELMDTDHVIAGVLGRKPAFFRPPYGVTNPMIARAVKRGSYIVAGWSVRSFDTVTKDPAKLLRRVTRSLEAGDVVLFHDYSDSMLSILPLFLDHVRQQGLDIVRLDELLNEKPYR